MAAAAPDYSYTAGLVKVLENPRWPVARACQAVEACLDMNKCAPCGARRACLICSSRRPLCRTIADSVALLPALSCGTDRGICFRPALPKGSCCTCLASMDKHPADIAASCDLHRLVLCSVSSLQHDVAIMQ